MISLCIESMNSNIARVVAVLMVSTAVSSTAQTSAVYGNALRILTEVFPGQVSLIAPLQEETRQEKLDSEMVFNARFGHFDKVQNLLVAGARVDAVDRDGNTALMWAAWNGTKWAVEMLLSKGASVNLASKRATTALMWAASVSGPFGTGQIEIVNLLLDRGAAIDARDIQGRTALLGACDRQFESSAPLVQLLLKKGASIEVADLSGNTPLLAAARLGHVDTLKVLLEAGANTAAVDGKGATAAMLAAEAGRITVIKLLAAKGVDFNAKDAAGSTALLRAAKQGQVAVLGSLIDVGADKDLAGTVAVEDLEPPVVDYTPLMVASRFGRVEAVKALIAKSARLNYRSNHDAKTALAIARLFGADSAHQEIIKLLLQAGAAE